ncbi:MAG: hypothetical protein V2A79_17890 [Planctomycetota bacterium]
MGNIVTAWIDAAERVRAAERLLVCRLELPGEQAARLQLARARRDLNATRQMAEAFGCGESIKALAGDEE